MKRLISLALLIVCSLTLCGAAALCETWRLTNNAFSDLLPKITIDNSNNVWVAWLSKNNGWLNPAYKVYDGSVWSATQWIDFDAVSQSALSIVNDSYHGTVWAAWDSASHLLVAQNQAGIWSARKWVNDSISVALSGGIPIYTNEDGRFYVGWTAPSDGRLREYNGSGWGSVETIFGEIPGNNIWSNTELDITARGGNHPNILTYRSYSSAKWSWGADLVFSYWGNDSTWNITGVEGVGGGMGGVYGRYADGLGIAYAGGDTLLVCYTATDYYVPDSVEIVCKRYITNSYTLDTTFSIQRHQKTQTGALCGLSKPCLAWSDSHAVFLNAYYVTSWSHPPVRISDSTLLNCINPDIVAENDSTAWVCYQNDGEIYVTRTSVPLGVAEKPIIQQPTTRSKISLKVWPNPARTVVHFSYTFPAKRNSSVSIYDIAGRLVKTLDISNNQINWDCADDAGRKVASGVYFARLRSDGQETIQRISIIK